MYWNKLHFLARQQYDATSSEMLMYSFSNPPPARSYWVKLQVDSITRLAAAQAALSTGDATIDITINLSSASADSAFHGKPGSLVITITNPFDEELDATEAKSALLSGNSLYKTASAITDYVTSRMATATLRQKWSNSCSRDGTLLLMQLVLQAEQYAKSFGNLFEK